MMPNPHLPLEILDYIVDTLHDEPKTLQNFCLVAKSWVPRTRKHLFARVNFTHPKDLESWKQTFPDPSNTPAYHTLTLCFGCAEVVTTADAEEGGWIRTFSRVVRLYVHSCKNPNDSAVSLVPLHGFSPVLKFLHVSSTTVPNSQIFGLIRSLPLIEDLRLLVYETSNNDESDVCGPPTVVPPSSSPAFTGTLGLMLLQGVEPIARWLLGLPNGLRFRVLAMSWLRKDDLQWINALVVGCADTLESLDVTHHLLGGFTGTSVDLSKATRLKDVEFWCGDLNPIWITMALQTVTSEHKDLQQISIHVYYNFTLNGVGASIRQTVGETTYGRWSDLDHLLIQFWESRSIHLKITYTCASQDERKEAINCVSCLLPKVTGRRVIDLVECGGQQ